MIQVALAETYNATTGVLTQTPVLRDLDDLRAEKRAALRDAVWSHVDAHLDAREREALAALQQRVIMMRGFGVDVDEWAAFALLSVLSWAESALMAWNPLAAAVDSATTLAELDAIHVDTAALGAPPAVTAAAIASALNGAA
jgi:hypothetical protein